MNKNLLGLTVLALMFIAQWIIPLSMAGSKETVLKGGTTYRFRVRPIDPNDPFRGKYVTLRFENEEYETTDSTLVEAKSLYVMLENDNEGFAKIAGLSLDPPSSGDYFKAKVIGNLKFGSAAQTSRVRLEFPFSRYYMEESKAPFAESELNRQQRAEESVCWAEVKVKDGETALEYVMIDGRSIHEWVMDRMIENEANTESP